MAYFGYAKNIKDLHESGVRLLNKFLNVFNMPVKRRVDWKHYSLGPYHTVPAGTKHKREYINSSSSVRTWFLSEPMILDDGTVVEKEITEDC
ncbi:MAG: hypothetical protein CUN57_01725 [Phototrophicales bacterium]|nr:MAG: hypothetical protein CUN57_01725 [Phototrophicales bacterium]